MSNKSRLNVALKSSPLRHHVQNGMEAIAKRDVKLIQENERSRIGDSLDLDAASKTEFPNENRWDYLVSIPDQSAIVGIEPHTAKDSEISVVIAKKKFAIQYLQDHFEAGCRVSKWYWVSHSRVGFSKMDRARRQLDQNGIAFERMIRSFG